MKASDWISVDDEPAPFDKMIQVKILNRWEEQGVRTRTENSCGYIRDIVESGFGWYEIEKITHWMPIVPPEVGR